MPRNVEIKARVKNLAAMRAVAERLAGASATVLQQEDTFFHVPAGRLKLRMLGPNEAQLIYYQRPDQNGPKTSHYSVAPVADARALRAVLASALGVRGTVRKTRWLCLVGRTRVHLDEVEGLGSFMELEVMLRPDEDEESGRRTAAELMKLLGVQREDLIDGAYLDLLAQKGGSTGQASAGRERSAD